MMYTPVVTQTSYTIEIPVEDMKALEKGEDAKDGKGVPYGDFLIWRLQGGCGESIYKGIDGVHSVEYNGHFGAAIYYTVDKDMDIPTVHELVLTMLKQSIIDCKEAIAFDEKMEA